MRVALYGRVSGHQQDQSETIETQRHYLEEWARGNGHRVTDWYPDADVQSWVPIVERPEGGRLLRDAARRRFDAVIIYKLSRWSRYPEVWKEGKRDLAQLGIQLLCISEDTSDDRASSKFSLGVRLLVNEYERDNIAEVSLDGRYRRASQGGYVGGSVPYGFTVERDPQGGSKARRLVIDEAEARWVREMVRWCLEERLSLVAIARRLNALEVPTACAARDRHRVHRGHFVNKWHDSTVHNMLTHRIYKGERTFGRNGREVMTEVPVIIDAETWAAVQQQLKANQKGSSRNTRRTYLLRGLLWCEACERTMHGRTEHSGKGEWVYYSCPGALKEPKGRGYCPLPWIRADRIEADLWEKVRQLVLRHEDTIEQMWHEETNDAAHTAGILAARDGLRATIHKKQEALARITTLLVDGDLTQAQAREQRARVETEIEEFETAAERLSAQLIAIEQRDLRRVTAHQQLDALKDDLDSCDTPESRRALIEACVERVIVRKEPEGARAYYRLVVGDEKESPFPILPADRSKIISFRSSPDAYNLGSLRLTLAGCLL